MNINEIATILKVGLILNYFDISDVIKWADFNISQNNDDRFIQISLSNSKNEIIHELDLIANNQSNQLILKDFYLGFYFFCLIKESKDWYYIQNEVLRFFSINDFILDADDKLFISKLNNDYSLRKDGFSGTMNLPNELFEFLQNYTDYERIRDKLIDVSINPPKL